MPLTTTTQVANLALSRIGAALIADLDTDDSEEARQARLHFEHKRDALLRQYQWNFGTRRAGLTKLAEAPIAEWESAWQLPADLARLIRIVGTDVDHPVTDFAIEGRHLLCNVDEDLAIVYVSTLAPVNEWDALFVDALVLLLASELAASIAQSPQQKADLLNEFKGLALPAAVLADAREVASGENMSPAKLASMSALVASRFRADGRPPFIPTASA